jgi:DmsE family decaheme c-type cytochrome
MNITRPMLCALLLVAGLAWQAPARALGNEPDPDGQYSKKGADTCLNCHDEESETFSISQIFKTPHAARHDKRAPFGEGGLQCEACHGPGGKHASRGSKKKLTIVSFKPDSFVSVEDRNRRCLACHENGARTAWHASAHENANLACTDCHRIHRPDRVLAKSTQPSVCLTCHRSERSDFQKTSSHPVRQGLMACSDCHKPHGSSGPAMLAQPTLNQTCYMCHADKRGPLLWEHEPVTEDCSLCHNAHGSVRAALLVKNPPQLCQQCHSAAGHPSVPRTGGALPSAGGGGAVFLVAGGCTNCHSQVHGSNHPSGAKLLR